MYCPNCGVKLEEGGKKCPLCLADLPSTEKGKGKSFYPDLPRPRQKEDFRGLLFLITLFFLIAGGCVLALDLIRNEKITYSVSVLTLLLLFYAAFCLPRWWRRPNPAIFLPVVFCCLMGALLYEDLRTGGGWFLPFALPVLGGFFLFLEAAVTLLEYVRGGRLYIFGGFFLAIGVLFFVSELLYRATFSMPICLTYSILPLILFCTLGMGLIVIAIVPPFRRYFERRFFL